MTSKQEAVSKAKDTLTTNMADKPGSSEKDQSLENFRVNNSAPGCHITTNWGVKMADTDTSLKASARGPTLMEDFHLREKIMHFDHERIPERVVHARGSAAHGYFQAYKSQEDVTKARFLCDSSLKTPVFVRFSTVLGFRGSPDTVRDVRGFATRFYTPDGNFDLVGNNIPVFFVQDAMKFPDVIHAGKPEPHNEIPQAQTAHDNFWDFISLVPETTHMVLWALSDRAIPRSYRMMQGFGVNTFVLVNAEGKRRFVKFHWRPRLGTHGLCWDESLKLCGIDPDYHRRDLWEAIESGNYPEYELGLQLVEEEAEHSFDFDILDATKFIPEELVPVRWVGKMVLDRNPSNFFAETEQVAFCTQHVVSGIDFSNDPLLQGRNFSYLDTQLSRLGSSNFMEIPINRPMCPVLNNQRDGFMRQRIDQGRFNYYPNRSGWPRPAAPEEGGFVSYAEKIAGMKERMRGPKFSEHFRQATLFWNSLSAAEQDHLVDAAVFELGKCEDPDVPTRVLTLLVKVEPTLAARVAAGLGLEAPPAPQGWQNHGTASPAVSMENTVKGSAATRRVAIVVADGFDGNQVAAMRAALKGAGAMTFLVGPRKGNVKSAAGELLSADFMLSTCKSVLFDAVFFPDGAASAGTLAQNGAAIAFANEAFKHCKPLCAAGEAVTAFLAPKCTFPSIRLADGNDVVSDHGVVTCLSSTALGGVAEAASMVVGKEIAGVVAGATSKSGLAGAFIEAIGQHRFWLRKVASVPA